jgi:predicted CXXCH cytochrome family protein
VPHVRAAPASVAAALAATAVSVLLFSCGETSAPPTANGPIANGDTAAVARKQAAAFFRPDKDRIPHALATNPGEPWGDWLGSKACAECHAKQHADWRESFHSRTLYDAVPKTVFGDFSGDTAFSDPRYGFTVRPFREGGKFWMDVRVHPDWAAIYANPKTRHQLDIYNKDGFLPDDAVGHWQILYAFGNRRHQPYVVRDAKGRYWVPPVYWNDVTHTWQYDGWRSYTLACAPCHVTGIKALDAPIGDSRPFSMTTPQKWSPPSAEEQWAEGSVGCESCHGPGRAHVAKVRELDPDAYRAFVRSGKRTIYCPSDGDKETRMRQCDSCHNFLSESTVTWIPGPYGYDHPMQLHLLKPGTTPDEAQFWPDGTHKSPCTVGQVFRDSKMGRAGVECRDCHSSHGNSSFGSLVKPLANNELCLVCHGDKYGTKERLEAHTHHPASSPGSSCTECHMPRDKRFTNGVQIMSAQLHSHAMSIPVANDDPGSPPASCLICHTDRDVRWLRATLDAWYPKKR